MGEGTLKALKTSCQSFGKDFFGVTPNGDKCGKMNAGTHVIGVTVGMEARLTNLALVFVPWDVECVPSGIVHVW